MIPPDLSRYTHTTGCTNRRAQPAPGRDLSNKTALQRLIVHARDDLSPAPTQAARKPHPGAERSRDPAQATGRSLTYLVGNQPHACTHRPAPSRSQMQALVQRLAQDPRVAYAEIDERVTPLHPH